MSNEVNKTLEKSKKVNEVMLPTMDAASMGKLGSTHRMIQYLEYLSGDMAALAEMADSNDSEYQDSMDSVAQDFIKRYQNGDLG